MPLVPITFTPAVLFALAATSFGGWCATFANAQSAAPGRLLVRFSGEASLEAVEACKKRAGVIADIHEYALVPRLWCVEVPTGSEAGALAQFKSEMVVEFAEYDQIARMFAQITPPGVQQVSAPAAWLQSRAQGVRVGVIDSGIDLGYPDHPLPEAYVSLISNATIFDDIGHGTRVAGIIAARDNTRSVVGVAPEASLLIAKACDAQHRCLVSEIINGTDWAVAHGARVLNYSLGTDRLEVAPAAFRAACSAALAQGIVIVCASGNDNLPVRLEDGRASYPGGFAVSDPSPLPVIVVSGLNAQGSDRWLDNSLEGTNFGPEVLVSAQAKSVLSTSVRYTLNPVGPLGSISFPSGGFDAPFIFGCNAVSASGPLRQCGFGGDPNMDFPQNETGYIAHILRGGTDQFGDPCTIRAKIENARSKGAAGVLISNNAPGGFSAQPTGLVTDIPAFSITQEGGAVLLGLASGAQTTLTISSDTTDEEDGTSFATPHVTGIVALMIGRYGAAVTPRSAIRALVLGADDIVPTGVGRDDYTGWGRANAVRSLRAMGCPADVASLGGGFGVDGQVTTDDMVAYLNAFFGATDRQNAIVADITGLGGTGGPDGSVTTDDMVAYLSAFFAGCP